MSCLSLYRKKYIVSGSPDGTLKLWCLSTGDCQKTIHVGFAACVWSICVAGDYVVCGCDENIQIWNLVLGTPVSTLTGHQDHVWDVHVVDSLLISCSEDCTVRIWKLAEPEKKVKKCKMINRNLLSDEESVEELLDLNM